MARSTIESGDVDLGVALSDLMSLVDPHVIVADALVDGGSTRARDVSIYDPTEPVEAGTIVMAVGVDIGSPHASKLVRTAAHRGAAAIVFRTASPAVSFDDSISIFRAQPTLTWTQLADLLRALVSLRTVGTGISAFVANSMDGLADAVAAVVGGSVVVYDRAHQVIGHALLGHQIDAVRRESICGLRTPEQWVKRFTEDDTAYRTFQRPGEVVRVDGYDTLRTRLRIAVQTGGEILGELSVAEGNSPLGEGAEEALRTAAQLAAPLMLRFKRAAEGDRVRQRSLLLSILDNSEAAIRYAPELGLRVHDKWLLVGLHLDLSDCAHEPARDINNERAARLLSMQLSFGETSPTVVFDVQTFYVLLPVHLEGLHDLLTNRLTTALSQLSQMGMHGFAAIGPVSDDLNAVPTARAEVDRLLEIGLRNGADLSVLTIESTWAELSMLDINEALGEDLERSCPPVAKLLKYDQEHASDLVSTLAVFMDEFGSISAAAERLFIHQNTLRHRLQRIADIADMDFANPAQRLVVSCHLYQVVRPVAQVNSNGNYQA